MTPFERFDALPEAARLGIVLALTGDRLGGINLTCRHPSDAQDWLDYVAAVRACAGLSVPLVRVPLHCDRQHLTGGLDMLATLVDGQRHDTIGLFERAHHSALVLPHPELHSRDIIRVICHAMDQDDDHRFALIAMSADPEAELDEALSDRIALQLALGDGDRAALSLPDQSLIGQLNARLQNAADLSLPRARLEAICSVATALGIESARASLYTVRLARCLAALSGEREVTEAACERAILWVLGWKARQLPATDEPDDETADQPADDATPPPQSSHSPSDQPDHTEPPSSSDGDDQSPPNDGGAQQTPAETTEPVALPAGLLDLIAAAATDRRQQASGRSSQQAVSLQRGRVIGSQRFQRGCGMRIDAVATLKAAAPWQRHRKPRGKAQEPTQAPTPTQKATQGPVVYPQDLRASRFRQSTQSVTIFVVDASGSAAARRLHEARGAVELLLSDCYVRRDQVAMIVFQGAAARLVLPPTRSLLRVRRELADMPAGGGTPLASALSLTLDVAADVTRSGQQPLMCLLTDGRANVDLQGIGGRERAMQQALARARQFPAAGLGSLIIDIAVRPAPFATALAVAAGGRYLTLPRADAHGIRAAIGDAQMLRGAA